MKRTHSHNGSRTPLPALGFGVAIVAGLLGTAAGTALAMPAPPPDVRQSSIQDVARDSLPAEVRRSLQDITWAASKVAAEAEFYIGLDDPAPTPPSPASVPVPHQVAPVE